MLDAGAVIDLDPNVDAGDADEHQQPGQRRERHRQQRAGRGETEEREEEEPARPAGQLARRQMMEVVRDRMHQRMQRGPDPVPELRPGAQRGDRRAASQDRRRVVQRPPQHIVEDLLAEGRAAPIDPLVHALQFEVRPDPVRERLARLAAAASFMIRRDLRDAPPPRPGRPALLDGNAHRAPERGRAQRSENAAEPARLSIHVGFRSRRHTTSREIVGIRPGPANRYDYATSTRDAPAETELPRLAMARAASARPDIVWFVYCVCFVCRLSSMPGRVEEVKCHDCHQNPG